MSDQYIITASFRGAELIRQGYATARSESQKTTRQILKASREEANAERKAARERMRVSNDVLAQKRKAERDATREALRATKEVEAAQRRMYRERQRLQREDLALTRLNIQAQHKLQQDCKTAARVR